jgi:hypothetical protein
MAYKGLRLGYWYKDSGGVPKGSPKALPLGGGVAGRPFLGSMGPSVSSREGAFPVDLAVLISKIGAKAIINLFLRQWNEISGLISERFIENLDFCRKI